MNPGNEYISSLNLTEAMKELNPSETVDIPADLRGYLGNFGPQIYDGVSGKPVSWGYHIQKAAGDDVWKKLGAFGALECIYPKWYLITKTLTRDEAAELYGEVTDEVFGPRGGWKSVTFGTTQFISKALKP